jgi:hypothetical protein
MNTNELRLRLGRSGEAIESLFAAVDPAEATWKPTPERWSLVEIACHLLDEEREDFRARLRVLAEDPGTGFPPIDPMNWVTSRRYADRDPAATIAGWCEERRASLEWLATVGDLDPALRLDGERTGTETLAAGDLMLSWLAHDLFHIRQIALLRWEYLAESGVPWSPAYAGPLG